MDQHSLIMARAWDAFESDRRRQELELNSDSGLSVLASSLFSGMEGIEVGGGTVIDQDG